MSYLVFASKKYTPLKGCLRTKSNVCNNKRYRIRTDGKSLHTKEGGDYSDNSVDVKDRKQVYYEWSRFEKAFAWTKDQECRIEGHIIKYHRPWVRKLLSYDAKENEMVLFKNAYQAAKFTASNIVLDENTPLSPEKIAEIINHTFYNSEQGKTPVVMKGNMLKVYPSVDQHDLVQIRNSHTATIQMTNWCKDIDRMKDMHFQQKQFLHYSIDAIFLIYLHQTLMKDMVPMDWTDQPGEYRNYKKYDAALIADRLKTPNNPLVIDSFPHPITVNHGLMDSFMQWSRRLIEDTPKRSVHAIITATRIYAAFLHIKPFRDSNAKIARLFLNRVLHQMDCPPSIVNPPNGITRDAYNCALADSVSDANHIAPLCHIVLKSL